MSEEWKTIEHRLLNGLDSVFMLILRLGEHGDTESSAWEDFVRDARERYEKGRAEHAASASTWDEWSEDDFTANIREELIDCVIYAAAREARFFTVES